MMTHDHAPNPNRPTSEVYIKPVAPVLKFMINFRKIIVVILPQNSFFSREKNNYRSYTVT